MFIRHLRRFVATAAAAALLAGLTPDGAIAAPAPPPPPAPAPAAKVPGQSLKDLFKYPSFAPKTARAGSTDDVTYQLMTWYAEAHADPEVREAAAAAIIAGDAAIAAFIAPNGGYSQAVKKAEQRRVKADQALVAEIKLLRDTGGPVFNAEVERVLAPTAKPRDREAFKAYGAKISRERDAELTQRQKDRAAELRARVQLIVDSTNDAEHPNVHADAVEALAGNDAAIAAFLESGLVIAGELDAEAREELIAAQEAELKAIEDAADLAVRSRKANDARAALIQAHGAGLRALKQSANALTSGAINARRAARILEARGPLRDLEAVKEAAAINLTDARDFATEATTAAARATTAADVLVNEAKLDYGKEWAELAQGLALSAEAAHQATQTAVHAIDATIATHKAIGHADEAAKRAEQAAKWKQQAIKQRDTAEKLAAVAKKEADAAEKAAARAEAHRRATEAKTAEAWEHARKTAEHKAEAQRQADIAADQREIAEAERQNAAAHLATTQAQAAEAGRKRGLAKVDEDNAAAERARADAAEGRAETARDNSRDRAERARSLRDAAFDAAEERDLLAMQARSAEAAAAALPAGQDKVEAEAAAREARAAANKAQQDADSAKRNADDATAAASRADAAATEAERASARARAAADKADAAAAASRRAASAAEAEAARTHQAAQAAQRLAAAATAEEVKAARASEAAERAARGAATAAVKSLWAADRSFTEATAAANEAASATVQSENAYRSAAAARSSATAALIPASEAVELLAPFAQTDVNADFARQVADLAVQISEEQALAAEARAVEAQNAAVRAGQAAEAAHQDAKEAYQAAARAAEHAAAAARDNARAKRAMLRAKEQGRLARASAASARDADAQARRDARDARSAANRATEDARIAGMSADEAERLSTKARGLADQAQRDADAAQDSARKAQEHADAAAESATDAEKYAEETAEHAEKANQYADEAQAETARLAAEIRASENADLDAAFELTPAMLADARDYLTTEQFASIEPFIAASRGDVSQFLTQYGPQLIGEFFNVDDIKACFSGKILSCLILVAEQLGPVRAFKALKLLYKATKAVKSFWDAVKKARKVIRNVTKKLDACQQGLIKDITGDLVGEAIGAAGAAAKARAAAAAGPKKKCKVDFPDACDDDFAGKAGPAVGRRNAADNPCVCEKPREQRHHYLPLTFGRPNGVRATLCPVDLKKPNSRDSIKNVFVVDFPSPIPLDAEGKYTYNRTHILADRFRGKPATDNLFTGYRKMNMGGMKTCENIMATHLGKGEIIIYSGQLQYSPATAQRPSGIHMTAYLKKSGRVLFSLLIPNTPQLGTGC
ncbi:DNA/RNA non-specific endonuclease [Actinoplanes auranticolor]|uniref:DNA/RNA non-specific endonuclease n=1 Tax=Actinoplanes auranticolor TaxID=47988 RepID=UPI001BB3D52A|nr:DNA/RNA non-specific endonuclease [Actinoplanes auranticolor]